MLIVEDLGNGLRRETTTNAPAQETYEARLEQLGPMIQDNPAASQSATAMLLAGLAQHNAIVAGRAGTIVGIAARSNAALTAGTATFAATVAGTAKGDACVLNATNQKRVTMFTTPQAFNAGDLLSITLATNGAYLPVTADHQAWLLIRWSPT